MKQKREDPIKSDRSERMQVIIYSNVFFKKEGGNLEIFRRMKILARALISFDKDRAFG